MWDLLPTIANAGGLPEPEWSDGISILPTLSGRPEDQDGRDYLYWEFYGWNYNFRPQQAVRMGKWKAYRIDGLDGTLELYDLEKDPGERYDLSLMHPHPDVRIPGLD